MITRRRLIGSAAGAAGAGVLGAAGVWEWRGLQGRYDHRRTPPPSAVASWMASLKTLDADATKSAGAFVHVGQSTHYLSVNGIRVLTDPWFHDPAFGAQSHAIGPAVSPEGIGRLDFVLITHDHPDHADPRALDRLDKRATVIVPTDRLFAQCKAIGYPTVILLEPWQTFGGPAFEVSAVPGLHDIYEVGYVLKGGAHTVYFAGDSRLHGDLPAIAERFAPTTAILSVDGTRLTGGDLWVMTPDDAVQAAGILKVKTALPSHADAYFSDKLVSVALASTIKDAPKKFVNAMKAALPEVRSLVPAPGELVDL